jgi:cytochrome c biogenesis protein CcmG, thiol:disulfide interchange protein DsbE
VAAIGRIHYYRCVSHTVDSTASCRTPQCSEHHREYLHSRGRAALQRRVKYPRLVSALAPRAEFRSPNELLCGLLIVFALLALSACYGGSRPPRIGSNAPDFTVQDSGRTVSLGQLRGQIVVLNFWATWCAPCVEEVPSLVEMQRRMKDKGVTVLAVSVDVDDNAYHQFLKDYKVNLLSVRDASQKSNAIYGTFKFPETYIIDRNGVMRRKFIGAVDWTEPEITDFLGKL